MQSEHLKSDQKGVLDRRSFLRLATAFGLTAASTGFPRPSFAQEVIPRFSSSPLEVAVERMRATEELIGTNHLTFEQANRRVVPETAEFFRLTTGLPLPTEDIVANSFIIEGNWREQPEVSWQSLFTPDIMDREPIRVFQSRYSHVNVDERFARNILNGFHRAYGYCSEEQVFVYLQTFNDPPSHRNGYLFTSAEPECTSPAPPLLYFRTTYTHELTHFAHQKEGYKELEEDILQSCLTENQQNSADTFHKNGFNIIGSKNSVNFITHSRFNEFVTDYLTLHEFSRNGLRCTQGGYWEGAGIDNFSRILTQCRISEPELREFQRTADIKGFLLKFAQGAGRIDTPTNMLKFAFEHTIGRGLLPLNWESLSGYFPGLDTRRSVYAPTDNGSTCSLQPITRAFSPNCVIYT
jgi:hypothetical protein